MRRSGVRFPSAPPGASNVEPLQTNRNNPPRLSAALLRGAATHGAGHERLQTMRHLLFPGPGAPKPPGVGRAEGALAVAQNDRPRTGAAPGRTALRIDDCPLRCVGTGHDPRSCETRSSRTESSRRRVPCCRQCGARPYLPHPLRRDPGFDGVGPNWMVTRRGGEAGRAPGVTGPASAGAPLEGAGRVTFAVSSMG